MPNFSSSYFEKSITSLKDAPSGRLKELLIVGRSNVGKSSLINALTSHKKLAYTSKKPGHTRLLNYYNVDNCFYIVDAPGYGYAKGNIDLDALFGEMMANYLTDNENLAGALLLLDSRREFNENDLEMRDLFIKKGVPYLIVITKCDKLNQSEKAKLLSYLESENISSDQYVLTSMNNRESIKDLQGEIIKLLKL